NAGRDQNPDVPGAAAGDVGPCLDAESGQSRLDGGEAEYVLRVGGGQPEDRRPADVLPSQVDRAEAEVLDQPVQVLGRGLAVVIVRRGVGVTEATQVHGDDPVAGGEQGDELAEGPPGLGEPVDQQDRGPGGPGSGVVQGRSIDVGAVVGDLGDGEAH